MNAPRNPINPTRNPVAPRPIGPMPAPSSRNVAGKLATAGRFSLGVWVRLHKIAAASIATVAILAVATVAVVLIRQDVTTTTSSKAPDVLFQNGGDYTGINAAGFATLTIGSSGTSATLALSGIPGAVQTSIGNLLKLTDSSSTVPYTVTLARSTTLDSHITSFIVTVKNGATTLATWDAASSATSSSFTLPVSTSLDISIVAVVSDGTTAGSLGSFGMQFSLAP